MKPSFFKNLGPHDLSTIKSEINCITCHNPHKSVKKEKVDFFESKCVNCHIISDNTHCANQHKSNCIEFLHLFYKLSEWNI